MKIKNHKKLATTQLRKHALSIAEAGLDAIDEQKAIEREVSVKKDTLTIKGEAVDISSIENLYVIGIGKGSLSAVSALEDILGERISGGIVFDVQEKEMVRVLSYAGDHPISTEKNVNITKKIIEVLSGAKEKDLILICIAGGGSALLCQPGEYTCKEEGTIVNHLFQEGATIHELNTVRKHLSLARGGHLAKYAYPAKVVSIIFSDVPGNDISFIASGPTVKDGTTIEDAENVLKKYNARNALGLEKKDLIETPKEDKYFDDVKNILFLSNKDALEAMANKAKYLGYSARICSTCIEGEAREVAKNITKEIDKSDSKTVLLYGGETTVALGQNPGKGGRSLELALASLRDIKAGQLLLPFASDGRDNTEFAGAICDEVTKANAQDAGLDIADTLKTHSTFDFFKKTGDYILTGPLPSNVADLIIALKK